jgi:hypothetical protein
MSSTWAEHQIIQNGVNRYTLKAMYPVESQWKSV